MTPTILDLSRRATAALRVLDIHWRDGSAWRMVDQLGRVHDSGRVADGDTRPPDYTASGFMTVIDLSDPLTAASLLPLVREAWGNPHLSCEYQSWLDGVYGWAVVCDYEVLGVTDAGWAHEPFATEAEAIVAALEAAAATCREAGGEE